jgi:purine nucleosidase
MNVLIDCDPGIDDALALLLASASPELTLQAVTTVAGNTDVQTGADNALAVLTLAGACDIPVAAGCASPLIKPLITAPETHGPTGMGHASLPQNTRRPQSRHAVDLIIENAERGAGELTLIAIGPLTNIALALRKAPHIAQAFSRVIIMGGAIRHQGNVTMGAEYNCWVDPHAAHIVFHSGMPITLVPLDVTYRCLFTSTHAEVLARMPSPITRFIADATRFYIDFHRSEQNVDGCAINDALAVALCLAPDLVKTEKLFVDIDLSDGISHATTFADFWNTTKRAPNMHVALDVDVPRFFDLLLGRMTALARAAGKVASRK